MTEVKIHQNKAYEASVRSELKVESNVQIVSNPKITLLMAFYNNVDFFKLVFASIETQSFFNFEVIICDDGSKAEAVEALRKICAESEVPVLHIWHEDRGFYKNEALNRGVLKARAEYLIFIDADCVLHPQFIEDHWNNKEVGHTLAGRRVNLIPSTTKSLTPEKIKSGYLEKNWWWLFATMFWMKDNNSIKGFRVTHPQFYKYLNRKPRGLVGCNFSVFKQDLLKINGFDMSYHKPGIGEDSDIDFRLAGVGVTPKPMCYQGVQYHLYHKLLARSEANESKFVEIMKAKKYITETGIKELEQELAK